MITNTKSSPRARKQEILARLKDRVLVLDGGMGSLLQSSGLKPGQAPEQFMLEHPDRIVEIHKAYVQAGSDMILTNTFGASPLKLRDHGLEEKAEEINRLAVRVAREAAGDKALVMADIGPSGQFLKPIGSLNFDGALWNFEEQVKALVKENPDGIVMETIADLREARAIAMAVRKHFDGLFIAQMTFTADGTTVTGTDPLTGLTVMQALGADLFGANCTVGSEEILPVMETLGKVTDIPLAVQPNAGMPELRGGVTCYPGSPESFAKVVPPFVSAGAAIIGGCCGTTPDFIRAVKSTVKNLKPASRTRPSATRLSSRYMTVEIDDHLPVKVLGERINPTARKKFSLELKEGVFTTVRKEAVRQEQAGAAILDINVGVGQVDETGLMRRAVSLVQESAKLPLCLDSPSEDVLEAGLQQVAGKCLINSVNGEAKKLEKVLPLVKRYGAAVLGLTLDEEGIPDSVEQRLAIARRIVDATDAFGIPREDVFIDPLCLAVSSQQEQALKTIRAIREIKKQFGTRTILGLSNISFGLPERKLINRVFLAMALEAGLDVCIANPMDRELVREIRASDLLLGKDRDGLKYIDFIAQTAEKEVKKPKPKVKKPKRSAGEILAESVIKGDKENILTHLDAVLSEGENPTAVNEKFLIPALLEVGVRFERKEYYLPQVILAAEAMQIAFKQIKSLLPRDDGSLVRAKILLATVKGDVHDIGKNIVAAILETHGYQIIDLGKNVEAREIAETALTESVDIVGLSALMTTTMAEMKNVIQMLRQKGSQAGVILGGAVTTRAFAESIGADGYAPDAMSAVPEVKKILDRLAKN
ncbi:MAG: homocysteine S-methyltransferase family protein [Planctomycetota bacterium]